MASEVVWGIDITGTTSGLLLALLAAHGQQVFYVPGRTGNRMAGAYRGEAKTDARDAYVMPGAWPPPQGSSPYRDSGHRTANMHRPKRYSRRLRRVFYPSAQTSIITDGPNHDFYLKKRSQGLKHVQALIALARRRVDVLWALLRDDHTFQPTPPPIPAA